MLDTHIWIWWVNGHERLTEGHKVYLESYEEDGLGISPISCWEIAILVEKGRLEFNSKVPSTLWWVQTALNYPGVTILEMTPEIAVASTELPGEFHRDPADRLIVATARRHDLKLVTVDQRILDYPNVETINFRKN